MSTFNFKVGDKVIIEEWPADKFLTITAVGETNFLAKDSNEYEGCWSKKYFERVWLPYTPPKKTVRMAQGVVKSMNGEIWLHLNLFPSRESADKYLSNRASETKVIIWPHTVNGIEQWVDVPVEE